ncbi:hypothetical protein Sulfitobl28_22430 [Sulfitobacter pontiacus]|nr:hypothetical protein Sulfitobl28_22430 [Sulfitobacter pontiacus]
MPETAQPATQDWQRIEHPFANAARGMGHLPVLRAAIRARQKLRIVYNADDGSLDTLVLHPYRLSHAARSWTLSGWDETKGQNTTLRLDLIEATHPLPALFTAPPVFQMD